ncbi:MAG: DUF2470 domain-containing protein [Pseudomonadota bacterium]
MKKRAETLQPVTDEAIRQAKTLIRTERYGALASLDPDSGTPMSSRVLTATDQRGAPIILISQLSAHFAAIEADARCSVMLGQAGQGDPMAHPRITLVARAERLQDQERETARARFLFRHPQAAIYADFTDFAFWRLMPLRASFNGGFAKAYEMTAEHVLCDADAGLSEMEQGAVEHMNDDHLDAIANYAEELLGLSKGDWRMASFDPEGMDLIDGDRVARLWFEPPLKSANELRPRLVELARVKR